jgi:uncharacterized protein
MTDRLDAEFAVEGAARLRGWLYLQDGPGPHPAITMAHGYAAVKEIAIERFAQAFAEDGFMPQGRRSRPLRGSASTSPDP